MRLIHSDKDIRLIQQRVRLLQANANIAADYFNYPKSGFEDM